jgi:D-alanyl-D-alanine carboxypeptidase
MAVLLTLFSAHPALAKYASIIVDVDTGVVLHEVNADTRNYPASLTKMMTLYMTFEALGDGRFTLDQKLRVSKRASGQAPSKLGLKRGETITVHNSILAMVTKSANDVATVIAESIGGDETNFANMMTRKAKEKGMSSTTFRNASGLPNRHQRSTARDLSVLARSLLTDYPEYYHFFSAQSFSWRGRTYKNHNKMLKTYSVVDGIKTGYTRASGFNLAASAVRYNRRLVGVIMGGRSAKLRNVHMATLLDKAFRAIRSGVAMTELGEDQKQAPLNAKEKAQQATVAKVVEAVKRAKAVKATKTVK